MSKSMYGNQTGRLPIWLIIFFVIIIIGILGWLGYTLLNSPSDQNQNPNPPVQPTETDTLPLTADPEKVIEPEDVRSYVGTILSINNNEISLLIPTGQNAVKTAKNVTVRIDAQTQITKRVVAKELTDNRVTFENLTLSDLSVNDTINVTANQNIASQNSFTATRINLLTVSE